MISKDLFTGYFYSFRLLYCIVWYLPNRFFLLRNKLHCITSCCLDFIKLPMIPRGTFYKLLMTPCIRLSILWNFSVWVASKCIWNIYGCWLQITLEKFNMILNFPRNNADYTWSQLCERHDVWVTHVKANTLYSRYNKLLGPSKNFFAISKICYIRMH